MSILQEDELLKKLQLLPTFDIVRVTLLWQSIIGFCRVLLARRKGLQHR